jgi:hypothetical protein
MGRKKKIKTPEQLEAERLKKNRKTQEWRKKNPEKAKSSGPAWRKKNAAKIRAYGRAKYRRNPGKYKALSRANRAKRTAAQRAAEAMYQRAYAADPENQKRIKGHKRKYYEANAEVSLAKAAKWLREHPEERRGYVRRRKADRYEAGSEVVAVICRWEKRWRSRCEVICYWCLGVFDPAQCHMDHVLPRPESKRCGLIWHSPGNVCVSCARCNLRKNRRTLVSWNKLIAQPVLF